jgi:hypothetical protein
VRHQEQHHPERDDPQRVRAVAGVDRVKRPSTHRAARYVVVWPYGTPNQYDLLLELKPGEPLKAWRLSKWPLAFGETSFIDVLPDRPNADLRPPDLGFAATAGTPTAIDGGECLVYTKGTKHRVYHIRLGDGRALFLGTARAKGKYAKYVGTWFVTAASWPGDVK